MAGLARVQQRFHAAVVTLLALAGFGRQRDAQVKAGVGAGHPIHAKYLRTQDYARATGRDLAPYLGYCYGTREARRRRARGDLTYAELIQ